METKNNLLIVRAILRLRTTAEGGRLTGIKTGYRPNHVFEKKEDGKLLQGYIGDIVFDDQELIQPGETKTVVVRFIRNPKIEEFILVGRKWLIYEVPKVVAEAEVIEILSN